MLFRRFVAATLAALLVTFAELVGRASTNAGYDPPQLYLTWQRFGNYLSLLLLDSGLTHPIGGAQRDWLQATLARPQRHACLSGLDANQLLRGLKR